MISKADATSRSPATPAPTTATAHGATGTATGVRSTALSRPRPGRSFTNVPGGTANWTFTDVTGNYNNKSGSVDIVISKADADCTVNGYTGVYDGTAHGATGGCTGIDGRRRWPAWTWDQLHQRSGRHSQLDVHRCAPATTTTRAARSPS